MRTDLTRGQLDACEIMNKVLPLLTVLMLVTAVPARGQQPEHPVPNKQGAAQAPEAAERTKEAKEAAQPGTEHATPGTEEHADEEHGVLSGLLWPVANFIVLFGGLWWLMRQPFANYLRDRHSSIRKDLVDAANVKAAAAAQLAEIDRKLQALPGEIDALRTRGAEEIAAEEQRIASVAASERERLLEQTRREIELQLRLAKRELVEHTANLAVQLAGNRLQHEITPADQDRLVDRYLNKVQTGDRGQPPAENVRRG
jgi:F-type H+-transporting ATPase subunit b